MKQPLRPYQDSACSEVVAEWSAGARAVLLVSPTGSGKTRMGQELVERMGGHTSGTVWIAHQRELIKQAAGRLAMVFGRTHVGMILPGEPETKDAPIQVATVQTLLARGLTPKAGLVVWDEAHHYMAEDWRQMRDPYRRAKHLGLTATPERADGKPLGDIFQRLVVAAQYSQLLADGHLVPCRVYQPPRRLEDDYAQDPLAAWQRYSEGARTLAFAQRVDQCERYAARFRAAGIHSAVIHATTAKRERDEILSDLGKGRVRVLWNVNTMTEGVDVPAVGCILLGRDCGHASQFLQIVGRGLRPHRSKRAAILIDLCGSSIRHGLPTDDRDYSLTGKAIRRVGVEWSDFERVTPEFVEPRVLGLELRAVGNVQQVHQLITEQAEVPAVQCGASEEEKRAELERLRKLCREHRMNPGFAAVKYRERFGEWPRTAQ